jgi:hypothetical protein
MYVTKEKIQKYTSSSPPPHENRNSKKNSGKEPRQNAFTVTSQFVSMTCLLYGQRHPWPLHTGVAHITKTWEGWGGGGGEGVLVHSKIVSEMVEARIDLGRKVKLFIIPF